MKDLAYFDKNFKIDPRIDQKILEKLDFFDPKEAPFKINGLLFENGRFRRVPEQVAKSTSEGVYNLHTNTAGGRIRFTSDTRFVAIRVKLPATPGMPHMTLLCNSGFDLYASDIDGENKNERYFGSLIPLMGYKEGYEAIVALPDKKMRSFTINMPLYHNVDEVYVALEKGSALSSPTPLIQPPVVYYGSSITQGGCASRPGASYQAIIHRKIPYDYINLGFSGNCRAEDVMIDYISSLDMSVFVYDYDHNAPNPEHLRKTHLRGYEYIRKKNPDLPIIMMTRPKYYLNSDELERLDIVKKTFEYGIGNGDKNLYFIDGRELLDEETREIALVDNTHPADAGFNSMARRLLPVIKEALNIQ